MNKLCALIAALCIGPVAANAEIVTINFEDLAEGSKLTSQYAGLGVHFSMSPVVVEGALRSSPEVISYVRGDFGTRAASLWPSPITIAFDSDVSDFSVLMCDTERGSLLGRVRAYDVQGQLMGYMDAITGPYNTAWFDQSTLRIDGGGIRYIELSCDSDGAVFDNITFTRVPTPGAMALLPAGLLGLAKRKRK